MVLTILTFLLALAVLILVHELGHFLAARRFGVGVEEFGLGFPPRILSVRRGGTRYSLNLIPLGGFVKIKGEHGESAEEPDSFAVQPAWKRAVILGSGVGMNFLLAIVLLSIGFSIGLPSVIDRDLPSFATVRAVKIQIAEVLPDAPAATAGFMVGDTILAADGQTLESIEQLQGYTDEHRDQPIILTLERDGRSLTATATPRVLDESGRGLLGIGLIRTGIVRYPVPYALWMGLRGTVLITGQIFAAVGQLLRSVVTGGGAPDLTGPVGIAVITGQVAKLGLPYVLQFVAILSVNLAIINALPIPALDGGRLLFLGIEKVRGRAVDRKLESMVHNIGFVLLILLMLVVTYRDVIRFGDRILGAVRRLVGG